MCSVLKLCEGLPHRLFEAGQILLEENKRSGLVYVLISGEVEIVRGDVQIDSSSLPGAVFGEMSILLEKPHTATVRATAPSEFFEIGELRPFLNANPAFGVHLCRMLARRLSNLTTYLGDLKDQFSDQQNHLKMVDEVLGTLVHHQDRE